MSLVGRRMLQFSRRAATLSQPQQFSRLSLRYTTATASQKEIKTISAKEFKEHREAVESQRPISPHFGIYKFPFAGLASGAQRATGSIMVLAWAGAALLAMPPLPVTWLPAVVEGIKAVPALHALAKGGLGFSFAYHGVKNTLIHREPNLIVANVDALAKKAIAAGLITATVAMFII